MDKYITINGKLWKEREGLKRQKRFHLIGSEISGLYIISDFISETEEQDIIHNLDGDLWTQSDRDPLRRIQLYGARYPNQPKNALPAFASSICKRIEDAVNELGTFPGISTYQLGDKRYTGLFVNEYKSTDKLRFHFDDRQFFKEWLFGLSMLCPCYLSFKKPEQEASEAIHILIPDKSLYIMSGDARYKYQHGIIKGNILGDRRVSITVRGIK